MITRTFYSLAFAALSLAAITAFGQIKSTAVGHEFRQDDWPSIAASPDGSLWVAWLSYVGERDERGGPGRFLLPSGISVDRDGRVYVVDQFLRKLEVFRPAAIPAEMRAVKAARG